MLSIIEDIKGKLNNVSFTNKGQIRFALISRILQSLQWDIWNPAEVYYDYPIKNFPRCSISNDENGTVDFALFILGAKEPNIYIKVADIGQLLDNIGVYEEQLSTYNDYDASEISIITDGIIWQFYFLNAGGSFSSNLVESLNLLNDDIEQIINTFTEVFDKKFNREKYRQRQLEEKALIDDIVSVMHEAEKDAPRYSMTKYDAASRLIYTQCNKERSIDQIEKFWDRALKKKNLHSTESKDTIAETPDYTPTQKLIDLNTFNPTFTKILRAEIFGEFHYIKNWKDLYLKVCTKVLEIYPNSDLTGFLSTEKPNKNIDYVIIKGKYLVTNLSARDILKNCIRVLQAHGLTDNLKIYEGDIVKQKDHTTVEILDNTPTQIVSEPIMPILARPINLRTFNPTYTKIIRAEIFGEFHYIKNWKDLYLKVCTKVLEIYPNSDLAGYLTTEKPNGDSIIINGIYLSTRSNPQECLKRCLIILQTNDLNDSLKIYKNDIIKREKKVRK